MPGIVDVLQVEADHQAGRTGGDAQDQRSCDARGQRTPQVSRFGDSTGHKQFP